jgi:hypothetical protein
MNEIISFIPEIAVHPCFAGQKQGWIGACGYGVRRPNASLALRNRDERRWWQKRGDGTDPGLAEGPGKGVHLHFYIMLIFIVHMPVK